MAYLLLKKLKGLICYLKNLKDQSVTNVKLKGSMNAFSLYNIWVKFIDNTVFIKVATITRNAMTVCKRRSHPGFLIYLSHRKILH